MTIVAAFVRGAAAVAPTNSFEVMVGVLLALWMGLVLWSAVMILAGGLHGALANDRRLVAQWWACGNFSIIATLHSATRRSGRVQLSKSECREPALCHS